jgi:hypothetical protein
VFGFRRRFRSRAKPALLLVVIKRVHEVIISLPMQKIDCTLILSKRTILSY